MSRRSPTLQLASAPRSQLIGVLVAAAAVAATTLLIYPLREVAPVLSTGVVYLVAVLLVATYWGLRLGLLTALASTAAFSFFHIPPTGHFAIADSTDWVGLGVYVLAAAIASTVANLAGVRADEAERRREEADLIAGTARVLLGGATLAAALPEASALARRALGLRDVRIVLDPPAGPTAPTAEHPGRDPASATTRAAGYPAREGAPGNDRAGRAAIALDLGAERTATLLLGDSADEAMAERVRARVAPPLQALLRAALERDRLQDEVVETQALRRSDVIKTALLRAVSHDLRTPLTSIMTAGHALRSPSLGDAERDELGKVVVDEAQRLSDLVDKLLDLSKLQAGAAEPRRDWCSLEEVIRTAAGEVGQADAFALSFDDDLPLVEADAAQLERVFVNLLENARRYSGGYPVKVRARVVAGRMMIRVIDRGPGMTAAQIARAFEPFYRGADGDTHAGSGLGLAIARGFVEANGGRVHAESLPGQGTVFVVELPLATQPAPAATHDSSPPPAPTAAHRSSPPPASRPSVPSPARDAP